MTKNVIEKTSPWDNETFDRVPADLFDDSFWDDGDFSRKEAFIDLYHLAYDDYPGRSKIIYPREIPMQIFPGEVAYSLKALGKRWGWGRNKVRGFFDLMESLGYVTIRKTQPGMVVKLNGYVPRISEKKNQDETSEGRGINEDIISYDLELTEG